MRNNLLYINMVLAIAMLIFCIAGVRDTPEYRKAMTSYRQSHPKCAWCYTESKFNNRIEVHHIHPVHMMEAGAADTNNMISLCRRDHFVLGHAGNWKNAVTNVREICEIHVVVTNVPVNVE